MKAIAWRLRVGDSEEFVYRLQCDDVKLKTEKKLFETMKDWMLAGEAWPAKDNNKVYVYQKKFDNEEDFLNWTVNFSWDLDLMSSTSNKTKRIKKTSSYVSKKSFSKKKKMGRPKKRKPTQCKLCGKTGHNARTCGR